jgi:pimeloyl-ACP methyl ester carboxylesterase
MRGSTSQSYERACFRCLYLIVGLLTSAMTGASQSGHVEGHSASGSNYMFDVPGNWNGKVLLYSHGYRPPSAGNAAQNAPRVGADLLLRSGFALVGSSYRSQGWAIDEAPGDQLAALDAFERQFGKPRRVIAWGDSMGGLTTIALIENHAERIDGALPMCGSVVGVVGMMNQALDASFALKILVDPAGSVALVGEGANNPPDVQVLLDKAHATPEGRARIVLAGVLAQIPIGSQQNELAAAANDLDALQEDLFKALMNGAFFPRDDQQRRANGNGSWNVGVDYRRQLELTGHRDLVEAAYKKTGLDLEHDLSALNAAPRIAADRTAVAYLKRNYDPSGRLNRPVLTFHTTGDGMTMPSYELSYRDYVRAAGRSDFLRQAYVQRQGHCTYTAAEAAAAVLALDARIETGRWGNLPTVEWLNQKARVFGEAEPRFVAFEPVPALRPCRGSTRCAGEP